MAINWPNLSPNVKPFTKPPLAGSGGMQPRTAYGVVPHFTQKAGVLPGQAPIIGHTVAPTPSKMTVKQRLANFPSIFSIGH